MVEKGLVGWRLRVREARNAVTRQIRPLLQNREHRPFVIMAIASIVGAVIAFRANALVTEAGNQWTTAAETEAVRDHNFAVQANNVLVLQAPLLVYLVEAVELERAIRAAERRVGIDFSSTFAPPWEGIRKYSMTRLGDALSAGDDYLRQHLTNPTQYSAGAHLAWRLSHTLRQPPIETYETAATEASSRASTTSGFALAAAISFFLGALAYAIRRWTNVLILAAAVALVIAVGGVIASYLGVG
jgi:hypothetical protein